MIKTIFGKRLHEIRTRKGIKLGELARRTGLSQQSLRRYEAGRSLPRANTVFKLADALETSVPNLMGLNQLIEWIDQETRDFAVNDSR